MHGRNVDYSLVNRRRLIGTMDALRFGRIARLGGAWRLGMKVDDQSVGITTTVPVEAIFAAGFRPVDLNNLFVSCPQSDMLVEFALQNGFPQNTCAWIKGIYAAVLGAEKLGRVVGVVRGDCSGTEVLLEILEARGVETIRFSYPSIPIRRDLKQEMEKFCGCLGTTLRRAERWRVKLVDVRKKLRELDRLCWEENKVNGAENHRWLVGASDFWGDPEEYEARLDDFLMSAVRREPFGRRGALPYPREIRLGYMGVPPISPEIFHLAESRGSRFVFHEVQRQFSLPYDARDLVELYLRYTYPYRISGRARDINEQSRRRRLDGMVHYVQSFCHRNMEDVIFAEELAIPLLTVECDCPGELGAPARSRLENFIQVLGENV